jgi:leukotriene-A4 hydrolase
LLQAGDRSLADVIAHEISHSWSGNLVGIKNFEHFWLNEGWTMFIQRKIEAKLFGNPHRHFSALLGLKELTDTVCTHGGLGWILVVHILVKLIAGESCQISRI